MNRPVLRTGFDVGLLSNVRMGTEISTGLAFLAGRRLSMPFERPIPPAPRSSIADHQRGRGATILDLFELPVDIVHPDEWTTIESRARDVLEWEEITGAVLVCDGDVDLGDPQLRDFANGRTRFLRPPTGDAPIVQIDGRLLSFYSYFFFAEPARRRQLHAVLRGVRPRRPYVELAAALAGELGTYQAAHIRRSDLTVGIAAYGEVTPHDVATNLAAILDVRQPLVVCSEVDASDEFFDPLRSRFADLRFANDIILHDRSRRFFDLPRHEDNALGMVTQLLAARATGFVGTMGSTFTALIQRERLLRDPNERFLFTADFTPPGPRFHNGEFLDTADGSYSWNRTAMAMAPDTLSWFREWPEVA